MFLLFCAGVTAVYAARPPVEEIIKKNDTLYRSESSYSLLAMEIQTPNWQRTLELRAWSQGKKKTFIRILAPKMAKAAELIAKDRPVRFIAVVPKEVAQEARVHLPSSIPIFTDCASDLLFASDAAIVKTGTASLEAVLAGTPHVAVYDVSKILRAEWCLLWAWRRIRFYAMPNIILEREVVPELIGLKCNPRKIADTLTRLITDESVRRRMLDDYALIRQALGSELPMPATERTAQIVEEMLNETRECSIPVALSV
jgi:lipid-A-disaccharide synthase